MTATTKSTEPFSSQAPAQTSSPPLTDKLSSPPEARLSSAPPACDAGPAGSSFIIHPLTPTRAPSTPAITPTTTRNTRSFGLEQSTLNHQEENHHCLDPLSLSPGVSAVSETATQLLQALSLFERQGIEPKLDWYLTNAEYKQLLDSIDDSGSFFLNSLRFNWTSSPSSHGLGHLELRMSSAFHDWLAELLQSLLLERFLLLRIIMPEGFVAVPFGNKRIRLNLAFLHYDSPQDHADESSTVSAKKQIDVKYPDGSIGYRKTGRVVVVLLVAFSQRQEDVLREAEEYLIGAEGLINLVIIIKLDYVKPTGDQPIQPNAAHHAVASLNFDDNGMPTFSVTDWTTFRRSNGHVEQGMLSIRAADMCPPGVDFSQQLGQMNATINIPHAKLCELVREAEEQHNCPYTHAEVLEAEKKFSNTSYRMAPPKAERGFPNKTPSSKDDKKEDRSFAGRAKASDKKGGHPMLKNKRERASELCGAESEDLKRRRKDNGPA